MKTPDVLRSQTNPRLELPSWMSFSEAGEAVSFFINMRPGVRAIPFDFEPNLVTEYYSKI
jgi:hypothetical protein